MKYIKTAQEKTTAIKILADARKLIAGAREDYVCCAITTVSDMDIIGVGRSFAKSADRERIGVKLTKEIDDRLGSSVFVTGWLRARGIPDELVRLHQREYRLRWIDSMIAELQ